jgi:hypothetical protein
MAPGRSASNLVSTRIVPGSKGVKKLSINGNEIQYRNLVATVLTDEDTPLYEFTRFHMPLLVTSQAIEGQVRQTASGNHTGCVNSLPSRCSPWR